MNATVYDGSPRHRAEPEGATAGSLPPPAAPRERLHEGHSHRAGETVQLFAIVGHVDEEPFEARIHALQHRAAVEYLRLASQDMQRRRMRAHTDAGTECIIALPREAPLRNGSILLLEDGRAIVVALAETRWLTLEPVDAAAALELGFLAGHLHWRVRLEGGLLAVTLDQPEDSYLQRLDRLITAGRIRNKAAAPAADAPSGLPPHEGGQGTCY